MFRKCQNKFMMNLKQFDLYGWNALKGQKLLAQGNALGYYVRKLVAL